MTKPILFLGLIAVGLAGAQTSGDSGQYQGPEILSRNKPDVGQRGGAPLSFRPYADVSYVFDAGLTPVSVNSTNTLNTAGDQNGVTAGFGLIGTKRWHFDQLSLEYRGNYTYYTPSAYFNGTSQYFGLDYTHIFNPRWVINLREHAGITPYSYGQTAYLSLSNTDLTGVPTNELFDNRTMFSQTSVDVTYQRTRRLSFSFGGDGYLIRRRSRALSGLNGGTGRVDAAYRVTRRQTVSASYGYAYYGYQRVFGNADAQNFALGYSAALTRGWSLALDAGAYRSRTLGVVRVPIDPAIALIVGYGYTNIVINPVTYAPMLEGRLSRKFERASLSFLGSQTTSPGNGVYLLSKSKNASVNYSYVALKNYTFSFFGGYSRLQSVAQQVGAYDSFNAGAGATYKLRSFAFLTFRYDYRHYTAQNSNTSGGQYVKNENRLSLGVAFSPGEKPLAIW